MKKHMELTHSDLIAYLTGKSDPGAKSRIEALKKEDEAYRMLFDLIEENREKASLDLNRQKTPQPIGFDELDDFLMRLFSANLRPEDPQVFIDNLLSSSTFYRQLILKLTQIAPSIKPEENPDMAEDFVRIRSDEDLLSHTVFQPNGIHRLFYTFGDKASAAVAAAARIGNLIRPVPVPRWAVALPAVMALLIMAYVGWQTFTSGSPFDDYRWDGRQPYPAAESAYIEGENVRSGIEASAEPDYVYYAHKLQTIFSAGMNNYQNHDYKSTIQILGSAGGDEAARELMAWLNSGAPETTAQEAVPVMSVQKLVQDYHFYLGVSYLARYRTEKDDLTKEDRRNNLSTSIQLLTTAQTLATNYTIETRNREAYFLGLAYVFDHKASMAIEALSSIKPESPFSPEAEKLIRKLGN